MSVGVQTEAGSGCPNLGCTLCYPSECHICFDEGRPTNYVCSPSCLFPSFLHWWWNWEALVPCGHTVCEECARKLWKLCARKCGECARKRVCPFCKTPYAYRPVRVRH